MLIHITSIKIVANMTEYAGNARRAGDLYGTKTLLSMAKKSFRRGLSVTIRTTEKKTRNFDNFDNFLVVIGRNECLHGACACHCRSVG